MHIQNLSQHLYARSNRRSSSHRGWLTLWHDGGSIDVRAAVPYLYDNRNLRLQTATELEFEENKESHPCYHNRLTSSTTPTPDELPQNGTTDKPSFLEWYIESASRRVRRLRQSSAARRRGRFLRPGPTTHNSLNHTGQNWAKRTVRSEIVGERRASSSSCGTCVARRTYLSLHTLHALHDKFDTRRASPKWQTDRPSFLEWYIESASRRVRRLRQSSAARRRGRFLRPGPTTHNSLNHTGQNWAKRTVRSEIVGERRASSSSCGTCVARRTYLSLHTLHALHDKFDTRRASPKWQTDRPSFLEWYIESASCPGPSLSPELSCTAPETLSASHLALPNPTLRRQPLTPPSSQARPQRCSRRSRGFEPPSSASAGCSAPASRLWSTPCAAPSPRLQVASRHSVKDVGFGRHPTKIGEPVGQRRC